MRILIAGTWRGDEALALAGVAEQIGALLATQKDELVSGGGTGISALVVQAYRANGGKQFTAYFPADEQMDAVGEQRGPDPDTVIETNADYPLRNVQMVRSCDGVIAIGGGLGTLSEVIHAVRDYDKKVAVIDGGELAGWIRGIPAHPNEDALTEIVL